MGKTSGLPTATKSGRAVPVQLNAPGGVLDDIACLDDTLRDAVLLLVVFESQHITAAYAPWHDDSSAARL